MPGRYHLEKSILFVGFAWRTNLFSIHRNANVPAPREISFVEELTGRLSQVSLPGRTEGVLMNMVTFIDTFEAKLLLLHPDII
jgi:hypothetical protein